MKNTISAGDYHSLGLRADCKIIGWGYSVCKQLKCPDDPFISIAAGAAHSLGLRVDGKVFCWGQNEYGQLNCPDEKFIEIALGTFHCLGLQADGKAICWGTKEQLKCPDEKFGLPYDFLARLNKGLTVLSHMPKYIKMEILEDYTDWTFGQLFYLN